MSISRRGLLAAVSGLAATGASGATLSVTKILGATGAVGAGSGSNTEAGIYGGRPEWSEVDPLYERAHKLQSVLYRHMKRTERQLARDGVLPQHGAVRSWSAVYKQRATDKKLDELMAAQDALENEDTLRGVLSRIASL